MKNVVKLDNYFAPEELEATLEKFVYRYNNEPYHESLNNLTPADVYCGRGELILKERVRLKKNGNYKPKKWVPKIKINNKSKKFFIFELLTKYSLSKSPI